MAASAEDNASNHPRKMFDPKKSTGTLVGAWLGQHCEVCTVSNSELSEFFGPSPSSGESAQ